MPLNATLPLVLNYLFEGRQSKSISGQRGQKLRIMGLQAAFRLAIKTRSNMGQSGIKNALSSEKQKIL